MQLPDEALQSLGWKGGDVLCWRQLGEGVASAKRCAEITPAELSGWFNDYYESIAEGEAYVISSDEGRFLFAAVETVFGSLSAVEEVKA